MRAALEYIRFWSTICLTIDGATLCTGENVLNMMACRPFAFFLELFRLNLLKESADNLVQKVLTFRHKLQHSIRRSSEPSNQQEDEQPEDCGDNDESVAVDVYGTGSDMSFEPLAEYPTKPEPNPHLRVCWLLLSDSPNVMRAMRRKATAFDAA